jgi:hypothetical protein
MGLPSRYHSRWAAQARGKAISNQNSITGAGCFTSGTAGGYGTGGGGALCYNTSTNGAGAAGAPGIVIVTQYK